MKNLSKFLIIYTIIFSEVLSAAPVNHPENAGNAGGNFGTQDIMSIAQYGLSVYGSYLGQKQQIMQQQINAETNRKLMAQIGPGCVNADNRTPCFASPAKFFPECTLPPSMSPMPVNVCNNPVPDSNQISTMMTYKAISQGWMNYYDQMSNEASNSSYTTGLRCLGDKQKAMDSQLTEMVNNLTRLQTQLNQDKEKFRRENEALINEMDAKNQELSGSSGSSKNNLKNNTRDMASLFSTSCQSIIGKDVLKTGSAIGLKGIFQGLSPTYTAADTFNLNKNIIEKNVRDEADKIAATIASNGVQDFLDNGYISQNNENIKSINTQILKQKAEFETAKRRLSKELEAVGYTAPVMDKNFSTDMNQFISVSDNFFEKKYINDCVTGAENGVAVKISDMLKSLKVKNPDRLAGSSQKSAENYSQKVKEALAREELTMTEKLEIIKNIPSPPLVSSYYTTGGESVTDSPYNILQNIVGDCKTRYSQSDKSSNGVTYAKRVERGRAALQELKNLNDGYASKITQAISNQVLNCNAQGAKVGAEYCSEETLKTSNDNFCVEHAQICANSIKNCYMQAKNRVDEKTTQIQNLANRFNSNVAAMISNSNALYNQQKAAVTAITQVIQARFPGTNFEIPKDMTIVAPANKTDTFGIEVAGDGKLSFLDDEKSMPAQIDKLKQVFQKQREEVKKATDEYINLQKDAMARERVRWDDLYNQCKGVIDTSIKSIAKINDERSKQKMQDDKKAGKFCKKYYSIAQNPLDACEKAKDLAEISDQIAARLSNKAIALSEQYASACDGFNNQNDDLPAMCDKSENDKSAEEKIICKNKTKAIAKRSGININDSTSKAKKINYASLCGLGEKTTDEAFIEAAIKKLSSNDQATLSKSKTLEKVLKHSEEIEDAGFFSDLNYLISSEKSGKICEKLKSAAAPDAQNLTAEAIEKKFAAKKEAQNRIIKDEQSKRAVREITKAEIDSIKETIDNANKELARLETEEESKLSQANKNKNFQVLLSNLASVMAIPDPTSNDMRLAKIQDIGQQMEGPCDMMNNSHVEKNLYDPEARRKAIAAEEGVDVDAFSR